MVLELVLVAAGKLIPLTVLELLAFVPLARVKSIPETAVAPAAAEASVTVTDCSLEPSAVNDVLVRATVVPEVPVPVTVRPVRVPRDVMFVCAAVVTVPAVVAVEALPESAPTKVVALTVFAKVALWSAAKVSAVVAALPAVVV